MFFTLSWLRLVEKAQRYSPDASRARPKDSTSDTLSSLYLKGFRKTFCQALGSGEPGRRTSSPPSSTLGNLLPDVSWGAEAFPSVNLDGNGPSVAGEELVWECGGELGLWVHDQPED